MKITIKEIAKIAGVSQATVSKIMNNYDDVSEETKQKVLKIMEEHDYRPSHSAKTLASKVTNMVGVVYAGKINADFHHPFFVEVMNSFKKAIGTFGYDLIFFANERFHKREEDYLERCLHYNVDGCIIIGGEEIEESVYDIDKSTIPCIGVDIELTGDKSGFIMTDSYKVMAKVVEHFYLLGHRNIGYIGGGSEAAIGRMRLDAFRKVMHEYGLTVKEEWLLTGDYFEQSGYEEMSELLALSTRPSAIFASSDLMAFGAIRAIKERGFNCSDFSIIGCDDIDASRYIDPPLTTVRQDKEKIGKLAAYMLRDLIQGNIQSSSVMVEPELILRQSCGKIRDSQSVNL